MSGEKTESFATHKTDLLGRQAELDAIEDAIEGASGGHLGHGSFLVLERPAGIGKTALTQAAVNAARASGLTPLSARGNEGESDLPFGVVRQLLEPAIPPDRERRARVFSGRAALAEPVLLLDPGQSDAASAKSDPHVTLHGLFWMCSNLAEQGPYLLVVDDLHWADAASARFVSYLANRVADLPLLLLVAYRTGEPIDRKAMDAILAATGATVLSPQPLDEEDTTRLVRSRYEAEPDPEFSQACRRATGGNPFLLEELLRSLRADDVAPVAAAVPRVTEVTPGVVARSVDARLRRLPAEARGLAEAISVGGGELSLAGRIAGLSPGQARTAADILAEATLIKGTRRVEFIHPLIRTAIYETLGPGERIEAHALAAETIAEAGGKSELIAMHLMHVPPAGQGQRVRTLMLAGEDAVRRGAPEAAVGYLRRALEEPPHEQERGGVLFELGRAEGMAATEEALTHLAEAEELATEPLRKIEILREIAYTSGANFGLLEQASDTLKKAGALAGDLDEDLELRLFAERATWEAMDSGQSVAEILRALEGRGDLGGDTTAERAILALLAWARMLRAWPASEVRAPAVAALRRGRLIRELGASSLTVAGAGWALANTFSRSELEPELPGLRHFCAQEGSRHGAGIHVFSAATLAHAAGRLRDAEALAKESLDATLEVHSVGATGPLAAYLEILCDLGQFDTAWRQLEVLGYLGELPPFWPFTMVHVSRGLLRAHRGDPEHGLEDVLAAGKVYEHWGAIHPAFARWRSAAAEIHLQTGEPEKAHQLVEEELQIARGTELPHLVGRDLRLLGCCEGGSAGIDRLREAVSVLEPTEARLEQARALIELGSALRRENRRGSGATVDEARALLRDGIDLAFQAGARPLVERGQTELRATGARPRNVVFSGPDSLTPSERRAAQMAADGMTNREIAEALFVTLKTVEKHLGNAYLKLDIRGRKELERALAHEAQEAQEAPA